MIFRQLIHDDLGCASYLVGDGDAGAAAVIDPRFEIDEYLELSRYLGVHIEHVLETHTHADHVSGHGRLAEATGATIHVHRAAGVEYPHEPFDDGWELPLGRLRVRAIHTPGHRPEHTAFALVDTARGDVPWAVLTGDSLFVGDVARPDLAVEREEGARALYRSLKDGLLSLPPETEVWPGHLGGSMCGGPDMDQKISSTIGFELGHNPILSEASEDGFVERALAGLGPQPPRFGDIVALNRGPLLTAGVRAAPLSAREVDRMGAQGALLVDVRTDLQFAEAHVPGSVLVTHLRAGFGTKLAWVAEPGQEIVFIGRDDADGLRAARLAASVGVRSVAGHLAGGMTSWREERRPVGQMARLRAEDLLSRLAADPSLQVLDVREQGEWDAGRIPGSVHAPYHDIRGIPGGIDPERPVAVVCASGQRSSVGASLLMRAGAAEVIHVVDGGVGTCARLGQPLVTG
ncbi:MAG TPA: MBL fold metallo-hydrolase [Miltoncostaeaceae bacterium]|nr:MBL fold metallo-hydrolase [Miltoncostaeaceae bacterium]